MHTERRHCECLAHVRMWGRVADGLLLNIPLLSEVSPPAVPRTNVDAYLLVRGTALTKRGQQPPSRVSE